jgi:hypothetical protein
MRGGDVLSMQFGLVARPRKPDLLARRSPRSAFTRAWTSHSTIATDNTFHQLAPYIGRLKTSIARSLVTEYTKEGDLIVDPFAGCGVVPLEAAASGRAVIAGDWNPYAVLLTRAKLFPPSNLKSATSRLKKLWALSQKNSFRQDLRSVPQWVRKFFHPETLRDALAFRDVCVDHDDHFLLACLLGILHHQRPGFLSYPSSHLVPYLRDRKFPRELNPEMYQKRDVFTRLEAKLRRAFRRPPPPYSETRRVLSVDARQFPEVPNVQAVITSPPYMNALDYVRDNRLRLWFIDRCIPKGLELRSRDRKAAFVELMRSVCLRLAPAINQAGFFILVVGDVTRGNSRTARTSRLMRNLFEKEADLRAFRLRASYHDIVPDIRRSRRECRGTKGETILIYQKN